MGILPGVADMLMQAIDNGVDAGGFTINRLMELFFAEAIRGYMIRGGAESQGWFRGLADPKVCAAMSLVHEDSGRAWSVATLAAKVGISPSRFAARFKEATGRTVISYVSLWRMHVATRMLRNDSCHLSDIAEAVGYESFPAFSRAFKKIVGVPPSSWRKI